MFICDLSDSVVQMVQKNISHFPHVSQHSCSFDMQSMVHMRLSKFRVELKGFISASRGMFSRLKSAVKSTPVSDSAVGQEDKAAMSRDRKRRSSDVKVEQEGAGYHRHKSQCLSHASSRTEGCCDESPSLVLNTPAPLDRQGPPGTRPGLHPLHHPNTFPQPNLSNDLPLETSRHDSEASDVGAAQVGHLPKESGSRKQFSFFDFPAEIRNMIYDHSLHWPDCVDLYRTFYRQITTYPTNEKPYSEQVQYQRNLRTPTILLLCRRVTEESLPMLKSQRFVIDRLPPFLPGGLLEITDFIGRRTLQSLHHIELRIGLSEGPLGSGWIWMRLLEEVLTVLKERNAFVKLRLLVRLCDRQMVPHYEPENMYRKYISKVCFSSTTCHHSGFFCVMIIPLTREEHDRIRESKPQRFRAKPDYNRDMAYRGPYSHLR